MELKVLPRVSGVVFYDGPSQINSALIIGIATLRTDNPKTGDMIQTWILNKDKGPVESLWDGSDESICGDCIHRGDKGKGRSCYVNVSFGPNAIYKAWVKGNYTTLNSDNKKVFKGKLCRLGAYGDPASIPYEVWIDLISEAKGYTGYSHQYKKCDQRFRNICMASVDSDTEYLSAKALGWRAFRVRGSDEPLLKGEFSCPASEEAGHRLTCENCLACSGTRFGRVGGGDVSIIVHGRTSMKKSFNNRRASE